MVPLKPSAGTVELLVIFLTAANSGCQTHHKISDQRSVYNNGSDFSSCARIMWEGLKNNYQPALSFFSKRRSAHMYQFHSFGQDQSTVAQQGEMTMDEWSIMSCV